MTNFISSEQVLGCNFLPGYNPDLGCPCSFHLKAYVSWVLAIELHPVVILWSNELTVMAFLVWAPHDNCPIVPGATLLESRHCQSHTQIKQWHLQISPCWKLAACILYQWAGTDISELVTSKSAQKRACLLELESNEQLSPVSWRFPAIWLAQ